MRILRTVAVIVALVLATYAVGVLYVATMASNGHAAEPLQIAPRAGAEVEIFYCFALPTGEVRMGSTVTNRGQAADDFKVEVAIRAHDDTQIGTGWVFAANVQPGEKMAGNSFGLVPAGAEVGTCVPLEGS